MKVKPARLDYAGGARVLRGARALILDPAKWTKGVLARDHAGAKIHPTNPRAVCFCAVGSVLNLTGDVRLDPREQAAFDLLRRAIGKGEQTSIGRWQDEPDRTHAEVLAAFDRAIEAGEKKARVRVR